MGSQEQAEAIVNELLLFASCYGEDGLLVFSEAKQNAIDVGIKMINHELDTMKILGAKKHEFDYKVRVKEKLIQVKQ